MTKITAWVEGLIQRPDNADDEKIARMQTNAELVAEARRRGIGDTSKNSVSSMRTRAKHKGLDVVEDPEIRAARKRLKQMTYTPVESGDEIRDAFEKLHSALQSEGTPAMHFGENGFDHLEQGIWSALGDRENRYFIGFGRPEAGDSPIFEANPPKEGSQGMYGQGLFVIDEHRRRHLVHAGSFKMPREHKFSKGASDAFRSATREEDWIDVDGKGLRFLIASIDESSTDVISRVARVTEIIYGFKFGTTAMGDRQGPVSNAVQPVQQEPLNQILCGPPGTGKTYETVYAALRIVDPHVDRTRDRKGAKSRFSELQKDGQVELVTFHQSYAYEDFIEGIRPVLDGQELRYKLHDGIFKEISRRASENPEQRYVLIIDEINRGNVAKIFGELITLIEPSKRAGRDDAASTTLPYSNKPFSVPANLHLVGTMNTADRGIALLDTALRRRFDFVERMPDATKLSEDVEDVDCQALLRAINERIVELLDRERQVGHTYLMGVATLDELAEAFRKRVVPLLQEYFYDDWGKLRRVLNKAFISKRKGKVLDQDVFEVLPADDAKWQQAKSYQDIYGDDRGDAADE